MNDKELSNRIESDDAESPKVNLEATFTIKEILDLCVDYDAVHGDYPEHEYEGEALAQHILGKLYPNCDSVKVFDSIKLEYYHSRGKEEEVAD